jgi:hypothetical protein
MYHKPAKEAVAKLVKEEQASRADDVPLERSWMAVLLVPVLPTRVF